MESQKSIKIITTNTKDKIFNVRKLPYKQFDNQKYLKQNYSPLKHHQHKLTHNPSQFNLLKTSNNTNSNKNMQYHYQLTLTNTTTYKDLQMKYKELKEQQKQQKQQKRKLLKQKEIELQKYIEEQKRIEEEQEKLLEKRQEICQCIKKLRIRKEFIIQQHRRNQGIQIVDPEYMRSVVMAMQFQGGLDINPDNMTYEELLELQDKIGKVNKGINQEEYQLLKIYKVTKQEQEELCSICYYNLKQNEQIHKLPCKHIFHCQCIKQWLMKQKVCPMCKQQLKITVESSQKNIS